VIWPNCGFQANYDKIELQNIVMTSFQWSHHHQVTEKRHQNNVTIFFQFLATQVTVVFATFQLRLFPYNTPETKLNLPFTAFPCSSYVFVISILIYLYIYPISDAVLNVLVRRVLDEVSEHSIYDSAHFKKI